MTKRADHAELSMQGIVPRSWYALTVKPQHEKAAAKALAHKRLEQYLPVYKARKRWSDRVRLVELPLFPGYVFCRFSLPEKWTVLATPGIRSLVSFGGRPPSIPAEVIDEMRAIEASGLPVEPRPYLREGERVVIRRGPLEGLEGRLAYTAGAWEVVVSVELLARSVAVRVDREALDLAGVIAGPMPAIFPAAAA